MLTTSYSDIRSKALTVLPSYTVPKKPWDPRITKFILSLNCWKSVGKLRGKRNVSEHVETVGKTASSVNSMLGSTSPNPNGGTLSHPVRNTITSCRVGEPWSPWPVGMKYKNYSLVSYQNNFKDPTFQVLQVMYPHHHNCLFHWPFIASHRRQPSNKKILYIHTCYLALRGLKDFAEELREWLHERVKLLYSQATA